MSKRIKKLLLIPLLSLFLIACDAIDLPLEEIFQTDAETEETSTIVENEPYDRLQEVVDYLDMFDELPPNYLTKEEARDLGWNAREGNLWEVAPDSSIGGDYFGNFEGLLPEEKGRDYHEADIEYEGGYRNAKRLIYSNDDLYFYTEDHYESFEEIEPSGDIK